MSNHVLIIPNLLNNYLKEDNFEILNQRGKISITKNLNEFRSVHIFCRNLSYFFFEIIPFVPIRGFSGKAPDFLQTIFHCDSVVAIFDGRQ